jgi:hypothetical protein
MKLLNVLLFLVVATRAHSQLGILFPMYSESAPMFNAAYAAADKVPTMVVINPDDGPGTRRNASLATFSTNLKARKGQVIGYINSFYGGLSYDEAEEQMNDYVNFYGVQGFFIDEVGLNKSTYYNTLKSRAGDRFLILNPGANANSYSNIGRVVVTFENPITGAGGSGHFGSFSNGLSGSAAQSGAIVYSTAGIASMKDAVNRSVTQGYDWLYVTNDGGSNPFDTVPSYWTEKVDYIARMNLPPPVPMESFSLGIAPGSSAVNGWTITFPTAIGRTYAVQTTRDLRNWSAATVFNQAAPAQFVATAASATLKVSGPAGAPSAFFRAADITP